MPDDFIHAPFSMADVDALNGFQRLGYVHAFTCPDNHGGADRTLFATVDGWRCPHCDYAQDWAHRAMLTTPSHPLGETLPCDVMLPPATVIRKGCDPALLTTAIHARIGRDHEQLRFDEPRSRMALEETRAAVQVVGGDYAYEGIVIGAVRKATGQIRYVVEDANHRLFIHNHDQIQKPEGWLP